MNRRIILWIAAVNIALPALMSTLLAAASLPSARMIGFLGCVIVIFTLNEYSGLE
ncbi:hypothetical protein So717_29100 [Roseobacter cerasinus]|uniref:Uncharacterized protein n=1 Tax=Roseobacter cerasinus TaxID=2602289 RepID=A0A640VTK0_9RHOB|nr:hypothetical protein [Roseobacter cerasinus]GFE51157.1 hypothetical protein So717_29100 [Roseobacter cerasinus]